MSRVVRWSWLPIAGVLLLALGSSPTRAQEAKFGECYARWTDAELVVGNSHIERRWAIEGDILRPTSFYDRERRFEWLTPRPRAASPGAARSAEGMRISASNGRFSPVEAPSLQIDITGTKPEDLRYRMQIFADARGVEIDQQPAVAATAEITAKKSNGASIIEAESVTRKRTAPPIPDELSLAPEHLKLSAVAFADVTDLHNQLVAAREWMFMNNEEDIVLNGNLFYVEDVITGSGLIFLKQAPPPTARPAPADADLRVISASRTFRFMGDDYPSVVLEYNGGRTGRITALQLYQRQLRQYVSGRDGLFLTNTWGDRNRDARITAEFAAREIAAGARTGADVVQIDDGWQKGRSLNSARGKGVANGFWSTDSFWAVDPQRFPGGISPLVAACSANGMKLGLWYAPDSSQEFANWQHDADEILGLYSKQGVAYFKFDSIDMSSRKADDRLMQLFDAILKGSKGAVVIDLDVTGSGHRPGYFGSMESGPIFVENRYTDFHRYWPHLTLRNLWQLSEFVDPLRLRMELLNNTRNQQRYGNDPLAPANYSPDALFATVMFSNPLGWWETSSLPPAFSDQLAPLVSTWKKQRDELFSGTTIPIGEAPDGVSWTGFASIDHEPTRGTMLLFRELNANADWTTEVLLSASATRHITVLGGNGTAVLEGNKLHVHIPEKLQYLWLRIDPGA